MKYKFEEKEQTMLHEKLTASDVEKIQEEIDHRKLVIRKEALESVKEARAHGDLSENFEYKAAKQYKNKNESRIRYLERMLKNAEIIEDHSASDEVGLNSVVRIYIPEDEEFEEYKIVTSIRGSSLNGYISIESPLGKALLGHKVGDLVHVQVNENYGYDVEIHKILESSEKDDKIRQF